MTIFIHSITCFPVEAFGPKAYGVELGIGDKRVGFTMAVVTNDKDETILKAPEEFWSLAKAHSPLVRVLDILEAWAGLSGEVTFPITLNSPSIDLYICSTCGRADNVNCSNAFHFRRKAHDNPG